jgi:16S rRNA (cytidine1402-2'-O)-methyltransferase
MHETLDTGTLDELAARYAERETRGEIVVVVAPPEARAGVDAAQLRREIEELLGTHGVKDAAAVLAARHGLPRRELYALALEASRERSS